MAGSATESEAAAAADKGWRLIEENRLKEAAALSDDLLVRYSNEPSVLYFSSELNIKLGRFPRAESFSKRALELCPERTILHLQHAEILIGLNQRREAKPVIDRTVKLGWDDITILSNAGVIYNRLNDQESARRVFARALDLRPGDPDLLYNLATAQLFLGDIAGADDSLDALLRKRPGDGKAILMRSNISKKTTDKNHIEPIVRLLAARKAGWEDAVRYFFALAKEYEDIGAYEKSFKARRNGAHLRRQHLQYDVSRDITVIDGIIAHYSADAVKPDADNEAGEGAIFIVGMPRTGTTLVERILDCHSTVVSAGELPDFSRALTELVTEVGGGKSVPREHIVRLSQNVDYGVLGQRYVETARQAADDSPVFIDKFPVNFLYCGLIAKALPGATIIHLTRNPMDTCYAVFKNLFNQAYPFSYDLAELADYYIGYRRLMAHWHAVMPGRILDVAYEDVVEDTEGEARRLLDWCGLEWEPEVLDFRLSKSASTTASAAQIRQPIYKTSVEKWRHYETELAPLKEKLQAAGLVT